MTTAPVLAQAAVLNILVADDNPADRLILCRLVERLGHRVQAAEDGAEAVRLFVSHGADIVLMDALMPVMDGYAAARDIRRQAGEDLVPIIFLTSLTETDALVECLQAGGDDFLSKPYNPVILQAKIEAFRRMREMHQTLQSQRDLIASQNRQLLSDQQLAKVIFDRVAHAGSLDAPQLRHLQSAFAVFNGDILLAARRPSGGMHVLLGDFTGHGLSAAIGAMPLAEVFYAMSARGFALNDILRELNSKLGRILPVGIFCCAVLIEIDPYKGLVEVWNGGLPEVLMIDRDGCLLHRIPSTHLPLGVQSDERFDASPLVLSMRPGQRLLCWTDGVIESRNELGEMFGEERVLELVDSYQGPPEQLFDRLLEAIEAFHGSPEDDLSLLELCMWSGSQPDRGAVSVAAADLAQDWRQEIVLRAPAIRENNPVPELMERLMAVQGLRAHAGTLFILLGELYSNALEHGLLQLDSSWKRDADGFARYYSERNRRLRALSEGWIRVELDHRPRVDGGRLIIRVSDSGPGFRIGQLTLKDGYAGRGLGLVQALTETLGFNESGNQVTVEFVWPLRHTVWQVDTTAD